MLGLRRSDDPDDIAPWQVALLVGVGLTVMLVLALFGLGQVVVAWWVAATVAWLAWLAVPAGAARQAARRRGPARTALWAPLVGPFALGAAVFSPMELLG